MRSQHAPDGTEEEEFRRQVACTDAGEEIHESLEDAKERLAAEQEQPCVRLDTRDLFAYLDLRNLREISEAFWDDFEDCIPQKMISFGMLASLETIRNALAHNRPLSQEALMEVRKARDIVRELVRRADGA